MVARLILKTKAVTATSGEPFVAWAAYPEGADRTDCPQVYSWAKDDATAKAEFEVFAGAFALTRGDQTQAVAAVLNFRMG